MVSVQCPSCLPTNLQTWKWGEFGVTASVSLRKIVTSPASFACTLDLPWLHQYLHLLHLLKPEEMESLSSWSFHSSYSYTPILLLHWSSAMMSKGIQALFHRWEKVPGVFWSVAQDIFPFSFHVSALALCSVLNGFWHKCSWWGEGSAGWRNGMRAPCRGRICRVNGMGSMAPFSGRDRFPQSQSRQAGSWLCPGLSPPLWAGAACEVLTWAYWGSS